MAAIGGKDTKPEMQIRKALHSRGFRYRLNDRRLPGRPDIVLPKYSAVIFVHGCFWHGHDCHLFKWPKTRESFWREKIATNVERDERRIAELQQMGWRVATVWECALRGRERLNSDELATKLIGWLTGTTRSASLRGSE